MPRPRNSVPPSEEIAKRLPKPGESALYTYDMLISLRRIAELQNQTRLVQLIEAAAAEAKTISRTEKA
jgi:hypothetical protein